MPGDILAIGTKIGPYTIIEQLPEGKGGMARVYVAVSETGDHKELKVAIKVARVVNDARSGGISPQQFYLDALNNEVETLRDLKHPNIVHLYPIPWFDDPRKRKPYIARATKLPGRPWFCAMEYIEGGSLDQLMRERRTLDVKTAAEIAYRVGLAVEYLHAKQIAHLDLKPDNVLFRERLQGDEEPRPVVIDFGIARRRNLTGLHAGALAYMAPERVRSAKGELAPERQPVDQRPVDVYSLGILLYRMLTGRLPFTGSNRQSITSAVLNTTPTRPSHFNRAIPNDLETVIMLALAKQPHQRPPITTMVQMIDEAVPLRKFDPVGQTGVIAAGPRRARSGRLPRWLQRGLLTFLILALIAISFGAGFLFGPWLNTESIPTPTATAVPTVTATRTVALLETATSPPSQTATGEPSRTPTPIQAATWTPTVVPPTPTRAPDEPTPTPVDTPTLATTKTPTATVTPETYNTPEITSSDSSSNFERKIYLQWKDVRLRRSDEYYVVRILDSRDGSTAQYWRTETVLQVPDSYYDRERKATYTWTVQVMRCEINCDKIHDDAIRKQGTPRSDQSNERTFTWKP